MSVVQCTPYCTPYTVRLTLYGVHCTPYTVRHTLYTVQCTPYCTAYTVRRTLYGIHCTPYNVHIHRTLYGIRCAAYSVCSACNVWRTTYLRRTSMVRGVRCVYGVIVYMVCIVCWEAYRTTSQHTMYTVQCTAYSVQRTTYGVRLTRFIPTYMLHINTYTLMCLGLVRCGKWWQVNKYKRIGKGNIKY